MPSQRVDTFTSYEFSDDEMLQACVLNPLQLQLFQTNLADEAQILVNFDLDLNDKNSLIQHTFLKAKVAWLQTVIDRHHEATKVLVAMARAKEAGNL